MNDEDDIEDILAQSGFVIEPVPTAPDPNLAPDPEGLVEAS